MPDEAEEAFLDALFRKGRDGRLLVYGVTDTGRFLFVVDAQDFEPIEIDFSKELEDGILSKRELKKPITLRLEPSQIDAVKKIAGKKGLPYQTLIRLWITERIKNPMSGT